MGHEGAGEVVRPGGAHASRVMLVEYNEQVYYEKRARDLTECLTPIPEGMTRWIDVQGLDDPAIVETLGSLVHLHPLAVEDIYTLQRPKLDDYGNYILIVFANLERGREGELLAEQVSLVLAPNLLITFHAASIPSLQQRRDRLRSGLGRMRSSGADYLAYALMDGIVDHMTSMVSRVQETLEDLEEQLAKMSASRSLEHIIGEKRQVMMLMKEIVPVIDVIAQLQRSSLSLFASTAPVYFRDLYDHGLQILDVIKSCRELVSSLMMIYLSLANNRLGEVMKVLTIFATLFAPMTFLTGYFGMNFHVLPLIDSPHGWIVCTGTMVVVALGMLLFFKHRRWI